MKPIVTLFVIVGVLIVMWGAAAVKVTEPQPDSIAPVTLSQHMISDIATGMSETEAIATIGCEPTSREDTITPAGTKSNRLFWKDAHGSIIYVRFLNGKLTEIIDARIKAAR